MAERRNKVINKMVGPWVMPGMVILADKATLSDGKKLTLTFPAKTIIAVITSTAGDTDLSKVTYSASVSNDVATVVFTKTGTGEFSYIVLATEVEKISSQTLTVDTSQEPVQ